MELNAALSAPTSWTRRTISEVCAKFTSGGTPSRRNPDFYINGKIPWVKTKELEDRYVFNTEESITKDAVENSSAKLLPAETLLMAMYGATVGKLGRLAKPMACNQACAAMIVDSNKAITDYLFYQLLFHREQIISFATGAAQQNLSGSQIKQFILPFPTLNEQASIGSLLRKLDEKIELNRQTNETLEALARAIFKDWFVDYGPTRAKAEGRPPYLAPELWELFPDALDDEDKPEGWEEKSVEDILELAYGKALKSTERVNGSVPVYGSGGITGYHNQPLVEGPSIIVGRKGTVGSLYWEDGPFFPIDTVFYVKSKAPLTFCFYLLQTLGLDGMNTDAAVPGLNRKNAYRLPVAWSGQGIRQAFDEVVTQLRQKMHGNSDESKTLAQTRDLLLPKLMSGEIRIKDAERIIGEVV